MKRRGLLLVIVILMVMMGVPSYAAETPIKVEVDGELLNFDVPPQMIGGRTLVPFRGIFEALGADVDWEASTKTAIGVRGGIKIKLTIGKTLAFVDSKQIQLDVAPAILDGRTFVPVRFIAESLGATVEWDGATKTVIINETSEKEYVKDFKTSVRGSQGLYEGTIQNDRPNGEGTIKFLSGNSEKALRYKGEFRSGTLVGQGVLEWTNGDKYTGEFLNDNRHGQGTMDYANGDQYVGPWKDDVTSGQGTITYKNGDKYVGSWENGVRSGQGTMTWKNGDKYVGQWMDDEANGEGTITLANGDKYVGQWKDGNASGEGTGTWSNGDKYVGSWENGERNGRGTLTQADGKVLSGEWKDDILIDNDADWKVN